MCCGPSASCVTAGRGDITAYLISLHVPHGLRHPLSRVLLSILKSVSESVSVRIAGETLPYVSHAASLE